MSGLARDMVDLFMEIIAAERIRRDLEKMREMDCEPGEDEPTEEELLQIVEDNFEKLLDLHRQGERFNQVAYAEEMRKAVCPTADSDQVWEYFNHYTQFVTIIRDSKNLPDILKRFRESGLTDWTYLKVDRKTFKRFAEAFVEGAEEAFTQGIEIDADAALKIGGVADFYRIELSSELRVMIDFQLCESVDDEVYESFGNPGRAMLQ